MYFLPLQVTIVGSNVKKGVNSPNITQIHTGDAVEEWTRKLSEGLLMGDESGFDDFAEVTCGVTNS